jgi:hypothetical protein
MIGLTMVIAILPMAFSNVIIGNLKKANLYVAVFGTGMKYINLLSSLYFGVNVGYMVMLCRLKGQ